MPKGKHKQKNYKEKAEANPNKRKREVPRQETEFTSSQLTSARLQLKTIVSITYNNDARDTIIGNGMDFNGFLKHMKTKFKIGEELQKYLFFYNGNRMKGIKDGEDLGIALGEQGEFFLADTNVAPSIPIQAQSDDLLSKRMKLSRVFTPANAVYPDVNYFVEPGNAKQLAKALYNGRYTLLYGHRQSGKTTTAQVAVQRLAKKCEGGVEIFYIDLGSGITINKGISSFWSSLCARMQAYRPKRFAYKDANPTSNTFVSFFSNAEDRSRKAAILIIDEASKMVDDDKKHVVVADFMSTIRDLKQNLDSCIYAIALIGTESLRNFLVTHQASNSQSIISPFSEEASFVSTRFSKADINQLLSMYAKETAINLDLDKISKDIYDLTLGHKGLVGTCCCYLETVVADDTGTVTIQKWNHHTPLKLPEFIQERATYRRITYSLAGLSRKRKEILGNVLRHGTFRCSRDDPDVKFLLAEGMVIVNSTFDVDTAIIECAAPILRSLMFSRITGPNIQVSNPPSSAAIDPRWLLERAVENLTTQHIFTKKTTNANGEPSEYAFQAEFLTILKLLTSKSYPTLGVLPEVKERNDAGDRRQRLDILLFDGRQHKYGFELVVAATKKEFDKHCECAAEYHRLHHCAQMFMINLCSKTALEKYFGDGDLPITPVHVVYGKHYAKIIYNDGEVTVKMLGSDWNIMFD